MIDRYSHGHGKSSLLRVVASKRHPGNVEGMRKGTKGLSPDNTKVADTSDAELSKDTVKDVTEQMHAQASHDGLRSLVTVECQCMLRLYGSGGTHK